MKLIIEGSAIDVRAAFVDPNAAYVEARAQLRAEQLQKDLDAALNELERRQKLIDSADRLITEADRKTKEAHSSLQSIKGELTSKIARIATQEAEIQKLHFEMHGIQKEIQLNPAQEAEIEAVFRDTLREYNAKPLVFTPVSQQGVEITAEHMFQAVFGVLAKGNRVGAIKEIRACTGMKLVETRDLIDNALRRFGCRIDVKGSPIAMESSFVQETKV